MNLKYKTLENLPVQRPVDRMDFIAGSCADKAVLVIGCFDETALVERETHHWLHGRMAASAKLVVGVDNSNKIPAEGLHTSANATIYRGDGLHVDEALAGRNHYDVVAGEFIEHIENPLQFFRTMTIKFAGLELIISTPNGVSSANTLLGSTGPECSTTTIFITSHSKFSTRSACVRALRAGK